MAATAPDVSDAKDGIAAWVPLFQTLAWIVAIGFGLAIFHKQVKMLWKATEDRLNEGAEVKIGPVEFGKLKNRIAKVEGEVDSLSDRVSRAFLAAMSDSMFGHLCKLYDGQFGEYVRRPALDRELRHLRHIGYVEFGPMDAIPECGDDLSQHVKITDKGRSYVDLKREFEALN